MSLLKCVYLDVEVIHKVTLENISKLHFILRSKITLDHARKYLATGESVSADTKLEDLNRIKKGHKRMVQEREHKTNYGRNSTAQANIQDITV